jgi:hypothetical protein
LARKISSGIFKGLRIISQLSIQFGHLGGVLGAKLKIIAVIFNLIDGLLNKNG